MTIAIIAAVAQNGVIGSNNQLIWRLSSDLKRFKSLTLGHPIIMGRKTFESIGSKPLPGRRNIVISRSENQDWNGAEAFPSIDSALEAVKGEELVFIIGGAEIYRQTLDLANLLYITTVNTQPIGDAHFPPIDPNKWEITAEEIHASDEKNEFDYSFLNYKRK